MVTRKLRHVIAQGLRNRGRRPENAGSCAFSISFVGGPSTGGPRQSGEDVVEYAEEWVFSIDPLLVSENLQLTLLVDRRLIADEGWPSTAGRRLSWDGFWFGADDLNSSGLCESGEQSTPGASTGERSPSSEDPEERLLIPGSWVGDRCPRRLSLEIAPRLSAVDDFSTQSRDVVGEWEGRVSAGRSHEPRG